MPTPSGVGIFIYSKPDAKRAALYHNKKLIECGYFEVGRRSRNRSLLGANEDFETESDAKRA